MFVVVMKKFTFLLQTSMYTCSQEDNDFPRRGFIADIGLVPEIQEYCIDGTQGCDASQVQFLQENCIPLLQKIFASIRPVAS